MANKFAFLSAKFGYFKKLAVFLHHLSEGIRDIAALPVTLVNTLRFMKSLSTSPIFKATFVETYDVAEYLCSKLLIHGQSFLVKFDEELDLEVDIKSVNDLWQLLVTYESFNFTARYVRDDEDDKYIFEYYVVVTPVKCNKVVYGDVQYDIFFQYETEY